MKDRNVQQVYFFKQVPYPYLLSLFSTHPCLS